jgi:hypothetical protein
MIPWLLKFLGGFLPIGTKPFPEWLGKVLWGLGMGVIAFFLMTTSFSCKKKPLPPPPTQDLNAGGSINNPTYNVAPRFGCATINIPKDPK